ncbi:TonB-dependent siderophore receptor [Shewanella livingstonensis]|uniref:TonB-dependent siderophore receptor n=1 Tax=Shewanella livingstonensis TaxID=150120 RepID=A0A3G8LQS1_9GAMM|nr:TonB-dependent siderophore receptor [Shewanella livingstonensis]AZG71901.1 TonB-dependent siderophore receptor [Shewanella livingstonensis]
MHLNVINLGVLSLLLPVLSVSANEQSTDVDSTESIEKITVMGRAQTFYRESSTSVGAKVETDIMDLPQSVQVLNEQLIVDQAAREITDLYRSIAGVSTYSYSGVTFRGFRDDSNVFYDGVRGDPFSGFGVPQLFNIERVEVLKGPAAALYGGGEPGGMINYVSKKPSFVQDTEVTLTTGDNDRMGGSIDSKGGLTDSIAYRLGGFYEQKDSFRNNADSENTELTGGLLFQLDDDTALTTTIDYIKQDLGGNRLRGVPVDDDGNFLVDPSYNANEKSDYQNLEATILQADLQHHFSDELSVNTTVRYLDNERVQGYHESQSWVDVNGDGKANIDDKTIKREYRKQYRANQEVSVTSDFIYRLDTGIEQTLLFGADYHHVNSDYDYWRARYEADGVANLNIFDLNYGESDPADYTLTDQNRDGEKTERMGFYAQDQINLTDNWLLLVGLRYDHFNDYDKESGFEFSDDHVSPRAGVVYKYSSETSFYVNYSESFNPTSIGDQEDTSADGGLAPEMGEQVELGIKNQWFNGSMMTTLAVYQINKKDVAMNNPADTGNDDGIPALVSLGEVESKGLEFTLVGDITPNWTVMANYAYNDARVTQGDIGDTYADGSNFVNAPRHQAGLWTRYDIDSLNSAIALGADYVSEQMSADAQRVKPYTVFDMSWTTTWQDTQFQLNVKNLFDKEYAVSGFSERNGHFPGALREVVLQVSHHF